jgi:hypothetical protein
MKTHLKICNEADYLQAHLTVIVSESRRGNAVFHEFKQRVTSILKKCVMAASADLTSRSIQPRWPRATSKTQRFDVATGPTASRPKT